MCLLADPSQVAVSANVRANPLLLLKPPLRSEDIRIATPDLLVTKRWVEPKKPSYGNERSTYRL